MDYTTKLSNNTNPSFNMTKVFNTKTVSKEFDDITNSYYKKGYEDAIEKACEWLEKQSCCGFIEDVDVNDFVERFRKAMEE